MQNSRKPQRTLALILFLNGMALMVLEMAGARLLAPWLGTSVIVWTSLIGIILASLSLGCWLGGRLADKTLRSPPEETQERVTQNAGKHHEEATFKRAHALLSALLVIAAILVLMTALMQSFVLEFLSRAIPSLHLAAVAAALALFAGPSFLCGMVSPYATRLAISRSENAGSVIGRLGAVSTLGSIAGTFLGGFVLVSWFGSMEIVLGVSACLLAAAWLAKARPVAGKTIIFCIIVVCGVAGRFQRESLAEQGAYAFETPYNSIHILKGTIHNRPARLLMTNPGSAQSGMYLDDPTEPAFDYTRYYALGTFLNPRATRILMLGGGGYSVPKWLLAGRSGLASPDFSLDVVELDPGITRVADKFFQAPTNDPRMHIHHDDARRFLNRVAQTVPEGEYGPYQLVFGDVFNSYYTVPFHVGTEEAARKIHSLLSRDGIFIMNIITALDGDNGRLLHAIRRAFDGVFGETAVFAVQNPRDDSLIQNVMLMAFRTPRTLPGVYEATLPPRIAQMLLHRQVGQPVTDTPALTDNFSPVERYTLGFVQ